MLNVLKPKNYHQRALGGHLSYYSIMTMVLEQIYSEIFEFFCAPMVPYVAGRGVSTFLIFHGDHFSMQYLGRSLKSFCHHDFGVRVNQFYEFCNFLRPDGTLGGWKVSQPS